MYKGKNYKIQYRRLFLLLFLAVTLLSSILFGASYIIAQMQPIEKKPLAIYTKHTSIRSDSVKDADQIIAHYFPKGKNPPPKPPIKTDRKIVALTFDDGPGYESTDRILNTLKRHDVKATFFVLGSKVEQNPEMLKKIHNEGHEIASHSYSHPNLTKLKKEEVTQQLKQTNTAIKNTVGTDTIYLRPPYGAYNKEIEDTSKQKIILWNVDSQDWQLRDGEKIKVHVLGNLSPQSIVLFHDIYDSSADAVEKIIPELKKQGYEFVTTSQYIEIMEPK